MTNGSCSAITNAMAAQGLNNATLATKVNSTEQRIGDVLANRVKPTPQEFGAIASALGLSNAPEHAAKVVA